jgi:hypothetical protein
MGGISHGSNLHEQPVEALHALFGVHQVYRPVHANGVACEGVFKAIEGARRVSGAAHLQGAEVAVSVRFSDFTGSLALRTEMPTQVLEEWR